MTRYELVYGDKNWTKILIISSLLLYASTNDCIRAGIQVLRGSTQIIYHNDVASINVGTPLGLTFRDEIQYLDSPNTTAATTYSVQFRRENYAGTYGGTVTGNYDNSYLTLMEVGG